MFFLFIPLACLTKRFKKMERTGSNFIEKKQYENKITENFRVIGEKLNSLSDLIDYSRKRGSLAESDATKKKEYISKVRTIAQKMEASFKSNEQGKIHQKP